MKPLLTMYEGAQRYGTPCPECGAPIVGVAGRSRHRWQDHGIRPGHPHDPIDGRTDMCIDCTLPRRAHLEVRHQ